MKSYIIIGILGYALTSSAGDLLFVTGKSSRWGFRSEIEKLILEAKQDALSNAKNMKQRSDWQIASNCAVTSQSPSCWPTVTASFESPGQSAPWFVRVTGFGRATELEEAPELTEPISIALAKRNAKESARFFCKAEIVSPKDGWKIWKGKYDYMLAENNFQCF